MLPSIPCPHIHHSLGLYVLFQRPEAKLTTGKALSKVTRDRKFRIKYKRKINTEMLAILPTTEGQFHKKSVQICNTLR